ncbi:hypothetical protein KGF54_000467 [Candida jiufengensis]|uniref:uncharacterized protein n=1 Tax=Candida jiufengensis TaxID=497108 RepID=UPI0022249E5D|nr:uncharacterized protein KGF54_000467 [Candida jiufengensis]KAI5956849.1 hypothetical protein KGF54_000467 [Candida jiufengensis]
MLKLLILQLIISIAYATSDLKDKWGTLWQFQGIATFAHLDHFQCLVEPDQDFDIGIIGVPFDTAVSYRPGARFGPRAIRDASQRQYSLRGYNHRANFNPYKSWAKINDCGDIPVSPMDNKLAFKQMDLAFDELLSRNSVVDSNLPPRLIALGGDHSVLLPHIRALYKVYGPLNILHFDAHLDTWKPDKYPSYWRTDQSDLSHGSMLWQANEEGLTTKKNVHVGIRTKLSSLEDYEDDDSQNWVRIESDDIWLKGPQYVIDKILNTIPKDTPTYISVDIDVLDPGNAPGTGTQESSGLLPRELIHLLRSIDDLTIVGADIVEVAPAYDISEITALNAAQVVFELLTSMVKKGKVDKDLVNKEVKVFN